MLINFDTVFICDLLNFFLLAFHIVFSYFTLFLLCFYVLIGITPDIPDSNLMFLRFLVKKLNHFFSTFFSQMRNIQSDNLPITIWSEP